MIPAGLIVLAFYVLGGPTDIYTTHVGPLVVSTPWGSTISAGGHPIEALIRRAEKEFDEKIAAASTSVAEAADAYRKRRGRHPPPGFDRWFAFAKEKDAIIVEDFWDQIYHDLEPFWALPAKRIRKDAWDFEMRIQIRGGKATSGSDWFWTKIWLKLLHTIEDKLPDMDLALNAMDEPRLVVPWEEIDGYMTKAAESRKLADLSEVISEYQKLAPPGEGPEKSEVTPKKNWENERKFFFFLVISRTQTVECRLSVWG